VIVNVSKRMRNLAPFSRFGWGVADQVLSSTTNFVLGLLVARSVAPSDFGAFSLAYATYTLSLGATRSLAGEPLVVRYSWTSSAEWRAGTGCATGTAVALGTVIGLGCVFAGWAVLEGAVRTAFMILGAFLPLLLLQDTWRFAFFARHKGAVAFLNDIVWAIVLFPTLALLLATSRSSIGWLMLAWAAAGSIAALLGALQARLLPGGPRVLHRWLLGQRDLAPRFAGEFAISTGTTQLSLFAIGMVAGLDQVGRLRAAQVALGPLNVLFMGASMAAVPEGVRLLRASTRRLQRAMRGLSLGLGFAALGWGILAFFVPTGVGKAFLGQNWVGAHSLLIPLTISATAFGLVFGPVVGLRSLAAARRSLRARSLDALMTATASIAGAVLAGAGGAAWGYALTGGVRVPNWWWHFSRGLREYNREKSPRQTDLPGQLK
jgi:O-antigen/teichoic acid export membrane protein